nr:TIGR04283 family arsenosugar biosynthesis glycosyltransferase [uncultured Desulfobulbus sp.]
MNSLTLSVIIPTLNEAEALPRLLTDIRRQTGVRLEVIVGDGGSRDGTQAAARAGGAMVVSARRGRGAQMNAAAAHARGVYLLFLHADSRLEDSRLLADALQSLREASWRTPLVAGHFALHFQRTTSGLGLSYRYMEAKTRLNRVNTTNGDQGLLLPRTWFAHVGGFDERLPFLEDQTMAETLRNQGKIITLPGTLVTSGRRFESEGFFPRYLSMGLIMVAYSTGLDDFFERLPQIYRLQHECGRLLLSPILRGFFATLFAGASFAAINRRVERIGTYLAQNCWQPFFFVDVLLQVLVRINRGPMLPLYDRLVAGRRPPMLIALLLGWGAVFLFGGMLMPLAWCWERGRQWWRARR